ncbi:MAG: thioredoxin domain-containing protein [Desulfobacterales bacterium]|nr:thioredoxin domain-containing protein [Desulfobacterales bacterium]
MLNKYPDEVNLVLKHVPLRSHKFAKNASLAALAAARQDKYNEISNIFLKNYQKLNDTTIKQHVEDLGLDMKKFEEDYKDPSLNKIVTADVGLSRQVKVRGVPALFINGRAVKDRSLNALSKAVEKELKKLK